MLMSVFGRQVMYEHRARLLCSAEAPPVDLFKKVVALSEAPPRSDTRSSRREEADLLVDNELGFAKDRTISRSICLFLLSNVLNSVKFYLRICLNLIVESSKLQANALAVGHNSRLASGCVFDLC